MLLTFDKFKELLIEWDDKTACQSSHHVIMKHPNFKLITQATNKEDIIAFTCLMLGLERIRCIFLILYEIVSPLELPPELPKYYDGRVAILLEVWKYWALKEGYVKIKYNPASYWVEDKYGNKGDWY